MPMVRINLFYLFFNNMSIMPLQDNHRDVIKYFTKIIDKYISINTLNDNLFALNDTN